ncbi:TadE-like protein [Salinisphaera sp. PC39]|uniref:TadE/TadG family type IV pilus assembly protein n=1 Tax=Salinisphaera sp. PC39 TaxID=1304156 RepID=UPI00333F5422
MNRCALRCTSERQAGAALVEFAFVLPILLAILVGTIYYGYVFLLKAAVTHAAREGAQVAVAVDPLTDNYMNSARQEAERAACASLTWLPNASELGLDDNCTLVSFPDPVGGNDRIRVQVTLPLTSTGGSALLPQANLPVVGAVPPLPATLVGVAEVGL